MKYKVGDKVFLIKYYDEDKTKIIPLSILHETDYEIWEVIIKKEPMTITEVDEEYTKFPYTIQIRENISRIVCDEELTPIKITNWRDRIK